MLSNELYYRVDSIVEEKLDINGFIYTKIKITVPGDIKISAYVGEKVMEIVSVGEYFYAQKAYVTGIGNCEPVCREIAFRIDYCEPSSKKAFDEQKQTVVNVNGLVKNGPKNILSYRGPMMVPTLVTTCIMKNEVKETFYIMLVGFHSRARQLFDMGKLYYADISGYLSARDPNKPCSIIVQKIEKREEVYEGAVS